MVLLTGGSTVALLALLTFAGAKPISQSVNWLILGTTLVAASFLAWSREWVKGGSGFIDIDFKSLEPIFEGHTTPQRRRLLRQYIGQRVRLTGALLDIRESAGPGLFPSSISIRSEEKISVQLDVFVRDLSFRRVSLLERGTTLTVSGRMRDIASPTHVFLSGCELPRIDPATPTQPVQ